MFQKRERVINDDVQEIFCGSEIFAMNIFRDVMREDRLSSRQQMVST